jgi:two-component system response regulator AtoC
MALCLVVEDQPLQRQTLVATLQDAGYQALACDTAGKARLLCCEHRPEMVLLDLGLPDGDGLELLPHLLDSSPLSRILVLTGHDSVREAVAALRAGARHYLVKPWDRDELLLIMDRELRALNHEESRRRVAETEVFWGVHPQMRALYDDLQKLRTSPLTAVLVTGETGTGKEVVARELHRLSAPEGSFVALNCAAIPSELMESELFGHEKGAFTGADTRRRGLVELSREGTLFLDEIAEMSNHLQAKLLRFLQDGSFRRVGAEVEQRVRCRVIAATHADADRLQEQLRQDLYYRLSVVRLELPPLRERSEDLLPLTHFLLQRIAHGLGRPARPLSPRAEEALRHHAWPGNVRELANRLERALVLGGSPQLEPSDLDLDRVRQTPSPTSGILDDPARLRLLLEEEGWNLSRAARRLGLERHKLKYRIGKLGLRRPR